MKGETERVRQEKTSQDATNVNTSQSFCDSGSTALFCSLKPHGVYKELKQIRQKHAYSKLGDRAHCRDAELKMRWAVPVNSKKSLCNLQQGVLITRECTRDAHHKSIPISPSSNCTSVKEPARIQFYPMYEWL